MKGDNYASLDYVGFQKWAILQGKICSFNPIALRMAKTLWSFGCSECNRVKCRPLMRRDAKLKTEELLPLKKTPSHLTSKIFLPEIRGILSYFSDLALEEFIF